MRDRLTRAARPSSVLPVWKDNAQTFSVARVQMAAHICFNFVLADSAAFASMIGSKQAARNRSRSPHTSFGFSGVNYTHAL